MKRNFCPALISAVGLTLAQFSPAAPVTVIHAWTMGEQENGIVGIAADKPLVDTVGDYDLQPVGVPVYAALGGALGVLFSNLDSAHGLPASEYFSSDEADVNPTDPARWGIEAIVRIDLLPANNQELAVVELGAGSSGIVLQTFGNGAWGLHQSNVAITNSASRVKVGERQHLAAVRNNGRWELYVDGLLAASFASPDYDPAFGIRIGAGNVGSGNNRGFNGVIESARIFEYADTFDINETLLGTINPDADRDGFDSDLEIALGFNPNDASSTPESRSGIQTAVEFSFYAAKNKKYDIEVSTNLQDWAPVEKNIAGLGEEITRLFSVRGETKRYFRRVRVPE